MIKSAWTGTGWLVALLLGACALSARAGWSLTDGADVHPAMRGTVPAASDVVFSTRFERPEAPEVIRAFGANRVEWVYTDKSTYVRTLLDVVPWFGGAVRTSGKSLDEAITCKDFDGQTAIVPRMARWGGQMLSSSSAAALDYMDGSARQLVGWGARSIHFDDPLLQLACALFLGGDFNPATLAGFPDFLARHPDQDGLARLGLRGFKGDYRDWVRATYGVVDKADYERRYRQLPSNRIWLQYMQATVARGYAEVRRRLDTGRSPPIPVSMNLSVLYEPSEDNRYFFLGSFADYAIAETHIDDFPRLLSQLATARALGMGMVASIRPLTLAENRVAVATIYAFGGLALVPWDVYTGNDDQGRGLRYFGKPEEYGDLYRFVRANAGLFDGMEAAAVVGIPVPVDRFRSKESRELLQLLAERRIPFAFVPVGGNATRFEVDPRTLARFRLLVSPNEDADFTPAYLRALSAAPAPRVSVDDLRRGWLDRLQPFFVAPGSESLRLSARARPGDGSRLVVHVVDAARGDPSVEATHCRRRVGISAVLLDPARVKTAAWVSPAGRMPLELETSDKGVYLSLPGCPIWGAIDLTLAH